ncbi:hypothetical protein LguiA_015710 [Lonicera macranthoides]
MAGTTINLAVVAGTEKAAATAPALTPSYVNSFRISAVADRLATHIRSTPKTDVIEFFNLCLSLARGIDYAIANDEVPGRAPDLPLLLKQVCKHRNDSLLQAAIMVLMISVKNACKRRWFSDKDSEELHSLANEIGSTFCSARDVNTEASNSVPIISTIMSRFYPRMKMGQILAFLEVKSGYGAFVIDFHISKDAKSSPEDKIRLFVAQTDNIETSSCIISPVHVNFLLNGKGVDRRTNVIMDTGPQNPTIVTQMLKYGTNLLQAVGQFNGNYIIVVAFMSVILNPVIPALQDYVQPAVASLDSDSSRFSILHSFSRIKTPVKGHLCKHLQVLKEVGENITDVIISADGSWKAVMETDEHTDKLNQKTSICKHDGSTDQENNINSSNSPLDIMDLTEGDDPMDVINTFEIEDRKPTVNFQSQPSGQNPIVNPLTNNTTEVNPNNSTPIEDEFWSGIYLSTYGMGMSSGNPDSQIIGGVSESTPTNMMLSPVLTDAVSPALNREPAYFDSSALQNQISLPNYMQQLQQFGSNINEYGGVPAINRQVNRYQLNRTPIAVQALPAQAPTTQPPPQLQRSRSSLNGLGLDGSSSAPPSQASPVVPFIGDGFNRVSSSNGGQHQFSRSHSNPLQVSQMNSTALQQLMGSQSRGRQEQSFISSPPTQPTIVGLRASTQIPNAHRTSSSFPTEPQNSIRQQPLHLRTQSPGLIRSPPAHLQRSQIHQGGTQGGVSQSPGSLNSQRARMMLRQPPSVPVSVQSNRTPSPLGMNTDRFRVPGGEQRSNMGGTGTVQQPVTRADGPIDLTAEQNWRPTGRMRGSLSGRAYSDALNQFIIHPTQPVQPARPSPNMASAPPGMGSQLHVLAANSRNAHANSPQAVNFPPTEQTNMPGGLGVHPERSSGMN